MYLYIDRLIAKDHEYSTMAKVALAAGVGTYSACP
jgi:hypothetical protein